jgi:hypothetical protein
VSLNFQTYQSDKEATLQEIKELRPDLLCLQEVWTLEGLELLKASFPQHRFVGNEARIKSGDFFQHGTRVGVRQSLRPRGVGFPIDTAALLFGPRERPFLLLSIHGRKEHQYTPGAVASTLFLQTDQAKQILALKQAHGAQAIVAGDFNAPPSGPALKILRPYFHSAFNEAGRGFGLTFPSKLPAMRIDHVLGTEGVEFQNYYTVDVGSDHLAQVVDLVIEP